MYGADKQLLLMSFSNVSRCTTGSILRLSRSVRNSSFVTESQNYMSWPATFYKINPAMHSLSSLQPAHSPNCLVDS